MLAQLSKNFFLTVSQNKFLNKSAKKWGFRLGASQVVADISLEGAIQKVRELNEKGLACTLDHLGEFVHTREEAIEATQCIINTLEAIAASGVNSNVSLKMTQLGLDIDKGFCLENMNRIMEAAERTNNFVRIDMEDYSHCQMTIDILLELRKKYSNVGTVIQAYLYRSQQDIQDLKGIPLRLVKGAYKEPADVAYQDKKDIDSNYLHIIKDHLMSGSYTAIATHDHRIIEQVKRFAADKGLEKDQYEFQFLYGFRNELQLQLVNEGYRVRVYTPYGQDWFGYFMRRLAERPQNISFALKGLFSK